MTHLRIEQSNVAETVSAYTISKLYDCVYGLDPSNVSLSGYLYSPSVFKDDVDYLREHYGSTLTIVADKTYIKFKDPVVALVMAQYNAEQGRHTNTALTGDGVGVTAQEAADIKTLSSYWGQPFSGNTQIRQFNEFIYFSGLVEGTTLADDNQKMFFESSIESIDLTNCSTIFAVMFQNCYNLTNIGSLSNVIKINDGAFRDCRNLSLVLNMPNLTYLGVGSFSSTAVTEITCLGNIQHFGQELEHSYQVVGVFDNCNSLEKIDLHTTSNLLTIGKAGCNNCASLKYIWLPSSITALGLFCFEKCRLLVWVKCEATTPPTYYTEAFGLTNGSFKIYVPDASVTAYQAASGWSDFSALIYPLSQFATDFPNG